MESYFRNVSLWVKIYCPFGVYLVRISVCPFGLPSPPTLRLSFYLVLIHVCSTERNWTLSVDDV